jgi:asparagine synthase (glutamine-hydrolysing)
MCGILGVFSKKIDTDRFSRSLELMNHRGPDDNGIFNLSQDLLFGHKRLSIQDLSMAGHQPMQTSCQRYTIVFNGEIYNFKELKNDLRSKGYFFNSDSDTEVILYMFKEYGVDCINLLNGDFAFAVYDKIEKELYIVRDRYGIKPLYYSFVDNELIFASEIRSILCYCPTKKEKNYQAYHAFLKLGSVPTPLTFFKDIKSLEAGCFLNYANNNLSKKKYYEYNFTPNKFSYADNLDIIKEKLNKAVKRRLVSDLPVGAFLSGGIDSSIIVALMRNNTSNDIQTFSIDFDDKKYSEGKIAKLVAQKYSTNHNHFIIQPNDLKNNFYSILDSMDSPTIDGVNTFFVSKFTKEKGISVAMSGLGGDEFFGGYSSFKDYGVLNNLKSQLKFIPKEILMILNNFNFNDKSNKFLEFLLSENDSVLQPYLSLKSLMHDKVLNKLFIPEYENFFKDYLIDEINNIKFYSNENLVSFFESNIYMSNQLLRDSDTMSMAHTLELRVPFLDHTLVNHINTIPGSFKKNKIMLIDSMKDFMPEEVYKRPKKGFLFPFEEWIRKDLLTEVKDLFFVENEIFNKKVLQEIWKNFENKKTNWARIWSIVIMNYYNQKHF